MRRKKDDVTSNNNVWSYSFPVKTVIPNIIRIYTAICMRVLGVSLDFKMKALFKLFYFFFGSVTYR